MDFPIASIKSALREVLEQETGFGHYEIANKWDGGKMVLVPRDESMRSKEIPLDAFFKKITAVREKLRVLEQRLNNHPNLTREDKAELQQIITRAYGSLTTFNILFKDEEDKFAGTGG